MSESRVPRTEAERFRCADVADRWPTRAAASGVVHAMLAEVFDPARAAWLEARERNTRAAVAVANATDAKQEAEAVFAEAFKRWVWSVVAEAGGPAVLRDLRKVLGDAPGRFLDRAVRKRLVRMPTVFAHARGRPELAGDPVRLTALIAATAALEPRVEAWEAARREHHVTSTAWLAAVRRFDGAWRLVVRSVRLVEPERAVLVPVFHRAEAPADVAA